MVPVRGSGGAGFIRIALDSIPARLAAAGLATHALLTLGVSGRLIWSEIVDISPATSQALYKAIGLDVLLAFGVSTATVVTITEVIDTIMVIAHFVGKKMKEEGRAEGLEAGRAEGRAEAVAKMNEKVSRLLEEHPELRNTIEPLLISDEKSGEG